MATANLSCDELSFSSRLNAYLILVVKSIDSNLREEFESFDLLNPHPTIFSSPTVISLLSYPYLPGSFSHGGALTEKDFCLPYFLNDLFRSVVSSGHFNPPFFDP